MQNPRPHVVVIGAGLIGAAIAYRLSPQARVTVVEANLPAGAASGRSFGWINASFFASDAHFHLRRAGIAAHHRLAADLPDSGHRWTGALWWEDTGPALDAMAARLCGLGYPLQEIAPPQFRIREPALTAPARSLLFPDEGAVDAARLTRRLLFAATDAGAQVWSGTPVRGLSLRGTTATGVVTDQGHLRADHVVLATGTDTPRLLAPLGLSLPMLPRPGLLFRSRPLHAVINHVLVTPEGEVRQDARGCILTPVAAGHQDDASETVAELPNVAAARTLARLQALLPGHPLVAEEVVLGYRPVPGDGLPVVGPVPGIAGATLAVMHSGVTLAALVAEAVAARVIAQQAHSLFAPFLPDRLIRPIA